MNKFENNVIYYVIINKKKILINDTKYFFDLDNFLKEETKKSYFVLYKMLDYFSIKIPKIIFNENGKPYFANNNLYFNYAHSKNYIICALSSLEIGVDIEEDRKISDEIANRYLNSIKGNKNRLGMWVKKEAYSKLYGIGFKIDFANININDLKKKERLFIKNDQFLCAIYASNGKCQKIDLELN